jgi:hypothetical protein
MLFVPDLPFALLALELDVQQLAASIVNVQCRTTYVYYDLCTLLAVRVGVLEVWPKEIWSIRSARVGLLVIAP